MASQQITDFLSAGDFYSAHQKARTTAIRLLAPPRRNPPPKGSQLPYDDKAREAGELLWDTARRLLEQAQQGSGVDLAVMMLDDVWTQRGNGCGKDERGAHCFLLLSFKRFRGEERRRLGRGGAAQGVHMAQLYRAAPVIVCSRRWSKDD